MRQLLQNVSTGEITVEEVSVPLKSSVSLLVGASYSLISAGTERAALELGRASLLGKARARPDLVEKVISSARSEGIAPTLAKVRGQLGDPNVLGYSLSGVVLESCPDSPAAPGEFVACAGAGMAAHAEVVSVPRTLCARIPDGVSLEDAAYTTVGAIALHGVRLAELRLGDVAVVVGLGLVGQLTLDLLKASGCVVLGIDPDEGRAELARSAGIFATTSEADLENEVRRLTKRRGADAVLVTAASRSSGPLATATTVARERANVVVVGDVAIESPRAPLFSKELKLVVSRSYGPGRYDPTYEQEGRDYPAGYVRWTEGRNLEEVLRLMSTGALAPSRLTTHVFDLADGAEAYAQLESHGSSLGILLRYPEASDAALRVIRDETPARKLRIPRNRRIRVGVVGAGGFARGVLMPHFARHADITAIATATGVSARAAGRRFSVPLAGTDAETVLTSPEVDAVVIATRHDTHADFTATALRAGKHVFVEKPLALTRDEMAGVELAAADADGVLMVGFNRRFAPLAKQLHQRLSGRGPLMITYRVNAGRLPRSHWTHDPAVGGGRIVGEVCHFVDFAMFLTGSAPSSVKASAVGGGSEPREDSLAATLNFPDGSVAVIIYSALGDPGLPKERLEVLGEAGAAALNDFSELTLYSAGNQETTTTRRDKGHAAEIKSFIDCCRDGRQPWPVQDMIAAMEATFAIRDAVNALPV